MRGRESVGNIDVSRFDQFFGELLVAFFLFVIKTKVFKQKNFVGFHVFNGFFNFGADAVVNKNNLAAKRLFHVLDNMAERILQVALAFRPAKMADNPNFGAFAHQFLNGGNSAVNAGRVGNVKIFIHRDVQIGAQHNDFAV